MYQNIFNLKVRMAKLTACSSSLFNESDKYRTYLEAQKDAALDKNTNRRFYNLLIYWGLYAILLFIKSVTAMPGTVYDILFYINYFGFIGSFVANLINRHRIEEKYDDEVMDTLLGMMRLGTTLLAFHSSLEKRHEKMRSDLSEEEKNEYDEYLKEHQSELDQIASSRFEDDEIQQIIMEIVHESDNNMADEEEYTNSTRDYLDHVNILLTDYLLEENAAEIRENYQDDEKETIEDEQAIKKTL